MPHLHISKFSCLKEADLELAPVTIIIGPQGSGKSVTTKLFYFFSDILSSYVHFAERGDDIEEYKSYLSKQFCLWFPPSAWGSGRFNISYSADAFDVRILRRKSRGKLGDDVSVKFSPWFENTYRAAVEAFADLDGRDKPETRVRIKLDRNWRVRDYLQERLQGELQGAVLGQTFIPAGRAFFTSIGKIVAGFEQAGSLDPVTIKFARLFANLRDMTGARGIYLRRHSADFLNKRSRFMRRLFGGEIKFENDVEFVETSDGRKIPFPSLSSGQQELLPMWVLFDYLAEMDVMRSEIRNVKNYRELIYIEEPEAHLFPSAQSLLMEFLIGSVISNRKQRNLIITTHSPYIMSKLNVFLKAGDVGRKKKFADKVSEIVPRECWLARKELSAFAIQNGELKSLMDEYGLIDGRYLDEISDEISKDFSRLLRIEAGG